MPSSNLNFRSNLISCFKYGKCFSIVNYLSCICNSKLTGHPVFQRDSRGPAGEDRQMWVQPPLAATIPFPSTVLSIPFLLERTDRCTGLHAKAWLCPGSVAGQRQRYVAPSYSHSLSSLLAPRVSPDANVWNALEEFAMGVGSVGQPGEMFSQPG